MCFKNIKKLICGSCEPDIVVKTIEKVVEKKVLLNNNIVNSAYNPNRQETPIKDKKNNKEIFNYLYSLNFRGDYYSQLESVINIKINKSKKYIEINRNKRLYSDGDFI